jgi:hypothetical protein
VNVAPGATSNLPKEKKKVFNPLLIFGVNNTHWLLGISPSDSLAVIQ